MKFGAPVLKYPLPQLQVSNYRSSSKCFASLDGLFILGFTG